MIETHVFEPWHADYLKNVKPEFSDWENIRPVIVANVQSDSFTCFTLVAEDQVMGFCGMVLRYPHVGEFWTILSTEVSKYPVSFHKEILRLLQIHEEEWELKRSQMEVKTTFKEGIRWAEALGFKRESVIEKTGYDNVDYYMYARFR